jgi:hypothetical protein
MRLTKTILLVLSCLFLVAESTLAQKRSGRSRNYNVPRVSRAKSKIVCPIFEDNGYPYQGLGFKLGDPFAVTYKYYPNKHWGVVVDFGKSASGLYSRYYSQMFADYTNPDTIDVGESVSYYSHKVKSDWVGELKLLYHINAEKVSSGLQAYAGLGWEARSLSITYDYQVKNGIENQISRLDRNRFTQGINVTIGIEYSYFKLPISAFMELEYYIDVMKDPGWRKLQGGAGLRYVF